jgi:hypothetical protein
MFATPTFMMPSCSITPTSSMINLPTMITPAPTPGDNATWTGCYPGRTMCVDAVTECGEGNRHYGEYVCRTSPPFFDFLSTYILP